MIKVRRVRRRARSLGTHTQQNTVVALGEALH